MKLKSILANIIMSSNIILILNFSLLSNISLFILVLAILLIDYGYWKNNNRVILNSTSIILRKTIEQELIEKSILY